MNIFSIKKVNLWDFEMLCFKVLNEVLYNIIKWGIIYYYNYD